MTSDRSLPDVHGSSMTSGLRAALASGQAFAVSKVGFSEQACCILPTVLAGTRDPLSRRALQAALVTHGHVQGGLFPPTPDAVLDFAQLLRGSLSAQDAVALAEGKWAEATRDHVVSSTVIDDLTSLDVRGTHPDHPLQVILDGLAGKDVLLITTPADFLVSRANQGTFEAAWSRLGRRWFSPRSIEALTMPDSYDLRTQAAWPDSRSLLEATVTRLSQYRFDVALIGAGLYGACLAAAVKDQGGVGISLGSQLQLLFGVQGRRWLSWEDFQRDIVNEDWVMLPTSPAASGRAALPDGGAYWS